MNEELQKAKQQVQLKEESFKSLQIANEQYKDKCYQFEGELAYKVEENEAIKNDMKHLEAQAD